GGASTCAECFAGGGQEVALAVRPRRRDFAVGCDGDSIKWRRQCVNGGTAARERPDAQHRVVDRAHATLSTLRERNAVDVLPVTLEHPHRPAIHWPQTNAAVP